MKESLLPLTVIKIYEVPLPQVPAEATNISIRWQVYCLPCLLLF